MSGLQDKLDNQAVEFDREGLWERIEKPKPQKPWWLWASLVLVVSLCCYVFINFNNKNKNNLNDNIVIEHTDKQDIITEKQDENLVFNHEKTIIESSLDPNKSEDVEVLSNTNIQSNTTVIQNDKTPFSTTIQKEKLTNNKEEIISEFIPKNNLHSKEKDISTEFQTRSALRESSTPQPPCLATSGCDGQNDISCNRFPTIQWIEVRHSYEIDALIGKNEGFQLTNVEKSCETVTTLRLFQSHNLTSQDTPPKGESRLISKAVSPPPKGGDRLISKAVSPPLEGAGGWTGLTRKKYKNIRNLSPKFTLIENTKRTTTNNHLRPLTPKNNPLILSENDRPNRIQIQVAYGRHKNHFGEQIDSILEYNQDLVREYVSFNTALTYERKLAKINLYGSLQYAVYQDNTEDEVIESTTYTIRNGQTYATVETTHYDLYNDYQFLALVGGIRKEWRRGNWAFSGAAGVGVNMYAYSRGTVLVGAGEMMRFRDSGMQINRRSVFGELDAGVRYYTPNGLYGQASLTYHSQKYINHQFDNYEQQLSTIFINLGIGKAF